MSMKKMGVFTLFGIGKRYKKPKPNINSALQNMSLNMMLSGMPRGIEITHKIKHEQKPMPNRVFVEINDRRGIPWRGSSSNFNYGRNWVNMPANVYVRDDNGQYHRLDMIYVVAESGY